MPHNTIPYLIDDIYQELDDAQVQITIQLQPPNNLIDLIVNAGRIAREEVIKKFDNSNRNRNYKQSNYNR